MCVYVALGKEEGQLGRTLLFMDIREGYKKKRWGMKMKAYLFAHTHGLIMDYAKTPELLRFRVP